MSDPKNPPAVAESKPGQESASRRKTDLAETSRIIRSLSALQVRAWLRDRLDNCARLAGEKSGKDRQEWLEDAAYFSASIGLIDWTEAAQSDGSVPSQETPRAEPVDIAREAVARWMIAHSIPTGHGDTLDDLLRELSAPSPADATSARVREAKDIAIGSLLDEWEGMPNDIKSDLRAFENAPRFVRAIETLASLLDDPSRLSTDELDNQKGATDV